MTYILASSIAPIHISRIYQDTPILSLEHKIHNSSAMETQQAIAHQFAFSSLHSHSRWRSRRGKPIIIMGNNTISTMPCHQKQATRRTLIYISQPSQIPAQNAHFESHSKKKNTGKNAIRLYPLAYIYSLGPPPLSFVINPDNGGASDIISDHSLHDTLPPPLHHIDLPLIKRLRRLPHLQPHVQIHVHPRHIPHRHRHWHLHIRIITPHRHRIRIRKRHYPIPKHIRLL